MESEASGDDTSNMFSKEFTATSSSPYIPTKSDHELTKTLSDMTEKFSVSSSTDAEASRDQTNETHSRATVSSLDSLLLVLYIHFHHRALQTQQQKQLQVKMLHLMLQQPQLL